MRWNWIFTFIYRLCYKLMLKSLKEGSSLKRESYFGQLDLITWQNFIFTSTFFLNLRLLKWTTYYIDIPWPRWENIPITIEALFLNRQFNSRLSIDNTLFADLLAVTFQYEEFNCLVRVAEIINLQWKAILRSSWQSDWHSFLSSNFLF